MNVGEYLVSKSPLISGTALAHLLAMQTGSGTGKTIFAAQMTVCVEAPQTVLAHQPVSNRIASIFQEAITVSSMTQANDPLIDTEDRIDVFSEPSSRMTVRSVINEIFAMQKLAQTTVVLGSPVQVFIRP